MSLRDHYDAHVLPHLIDLVMRAPMASNERAALVPRARGRVLEIGAGSGLNFAHFSAAVEHLYALEPNAKLRAKAQARAHLAPCPVEFVGLHGESIPLPDASVDTVLCTWVMCSIPDVARALSEMHRVLKPGGTLLYVEHGLAPEPGVAKWQNRLTPLWSVCAGGCHLNRRPDALLQQAGFELADAEQTYLDGPRLLTYHYRGAAKKPA